MVSLDGVMFWLHYGYVMAAAMAASLLPASSARSEAVLWLGCLQFLQLLKFASSFPIHTLPALGSVNSEIQRDNRHR